MGENLLSAADTAAARRAWLEKLSEYGDIGTSFLWLPAGGNVAERMQRALWRVYNHSYGGGSDFSACLSDCIPLVFRLLSHLVADINDFEALAERMPEVLKALPYEKSAYLDGTDYTFDTTRLQQLSMQATTVADFLAGFLQARSTPTRAPDSCLAKPTPAAWKSEFSEEIAELDRLGLSLVDADDQDLTGKISRYYAHDLSEAVHNRQELHNLIAVLHDAAAWHEMAGRHKWPARVLARAIAAMPDPARQLKQLLPQGSALASMPGENQVLVLRFLAFPDSGLIRTVSAHLPIIDPLLKSQQAVTAFIDLLVLMNFNMNINFGDFLAALPEIAAATGQTDGVVAFYLAREMLVAGHYLCGSDDWLSPLCEVVRAVSQGEPALIKDVVKLFACGELVRYCMPLLQHGILWSDIRDNLLQMWERLRKNYSLSSEARLAVAEIFAREVANITSSADFAVFCGMIPAGLSPLSRPRGRFFQPRFPSDPPESMPGTDPIPSDMSVRLLAPYPPEVEKKGFRHVSVWWNGRAAALEFNELSSAISGNIRDASYSLSGTDIWALRTLAGAKFPPEGNEASLQLTARTLGISMAKLHDLLEKGRSDAFPEKGQYDDR